MSAGRSQRAVVADATPERSGRVRWGWFAAIVVVVVLVVVAWFLGEWIARGVVTSTIRQQVVTQLALPADQQVDVEVAGVVIPQLIAGTLDDVTIASDDVSLSHALAGDVRVHATGVRIRGDVAAASASAEVVLDTAQLRALLARIDGFPADTVGLAAPDLTVTVDLAVLGQSVPIGVALTPAARDGELVLTPAALQLGGVGITADDVRRRFGGVADLVLREWRVCLADELPRALTLTSVAVEGDAVVADLDIDPAIVSDPSLRQTGSCA